MVKDADTAKETCLSVLKALDFIVTLRPASRNKKPAQYRERYQTDPEFRAKMLARKRDRTKEIARRSAMRAKVRAEKAAAKLALIDAEFAKAKADSPAEIQADSAL